MTDLIDSRGYFWPADLTVASGRIAPEGAVPGRLRVRPNGATELDLDGILAGNGLGDAARRVIFHGPVSFSIGGILADKGQHVLLSVLSNNGGQLGGPRPSHEGFIARRCLVSTEAFAPTGSRSYRWLDLPLDGYEDWIGRGGISVEDGRRSVKAAYAKSPTRRWRTGRRTLELLRFLTGTSGEHRIEIKWREKAVLRYGLEAACRDIGELIDLALRMEELLMLLSDCDRALDFPTVRSGRHAPPVTMYFERGPRQQAPPAEWHKAWATYGACADQLGCIVETWLDQYRVHGPGFHLYLGNRRGLSMYPEHRFASLIWGLEALDRTLHPARPDIDQAEKVNRILDQIRPSGDRRWAARFLPRTTELNLTQRIVKLFGNLPIGISKRELNAFAERCAIRRNDVSHFGGARQADGYEEFLSEIVRLSAVVEVLYHAVLLQIAGVPDTLIRRRFFDGPHGHAVRELLKRSGIVLRPTEPQR